MNPAPEHDRPRRGRKPVPRRPAPPERRAYPNAPTVTQPSYARPGTARQSDTSHTPPPIPATVWTLPPAAPEPPGSPAATGTSAAAITAAIVAAFSEPHGRVGILPWPTAATDLLAVRPAATAATTATAAMGDGGALGAASAAAGEVSAAITAQHRSPILLSLPTDAAAAATDLPPSTVLGQLRLIQTAPSPADGSVGSAEQRVAAPIAQRPAVPSEPVAPLDLIISSVAPLDVDEAKAVRVALAAGLALRLGGVLTVLTHSHREDGRLVDPGGRLVSAAQNADLLYLQHIVVVHTSTAEPTAASETGSDPVAARPHPWPVRHRRDPHRSLCVWAAPRSPRSRQRCRPRPPRRRHVGDEPGLHSYHRSGLMTPTPDPRGRRPRSAPTVSGLTAERPLRLVPLDAALTDPIDPARVGVATTVWATAQSTPTVQRRGRYVPESTAHPAKMLPAIAAHAIRHYTTPGEVVLDPMCGIGTTLVEALHTGRPAVGVEYEPHWVATTRANLALAHQHGAVQTGQVFRGDARHLAAVLPAGLRGQVGLVVTSPPYGPSTHGQVAVVPGVAVQKYHHRYGSTLDRGNLANIGHHRLLAGFTTILAELQPYLRIGGHVVITVRPWREHSELIDLPTQILACGVAAGLVPVERCVALLARITNQHAIVTRGSFFQRDFIRKQREAGLPLHLIAHEDVIIFRKSVPPDA